MEQKHAIGNKWFPVIAVENLQTQLPAIQQFNLPEVTSGESIDQSPSHFTISTRTIDPLTQSVATVSHVVPNPLGSPLITVQTAPHPLDEEYSVYSPQEK